MSAPLHRRRPDVEARSWLLFGEIVGENWHGRSRGIQIADEIEYYVACHRLRSGDRLGTEQDLTQRFSASRRLLRQASRALRARGLITVQRGQYGGQVVASVDRKSVLDAFAYALPGPRTKQHAQQALIAIGDALAHQPGEAAAFARAVLVRLSEDCGRSWSPSPETLAASIAVEIERDIGFWIARASAPPSGGLEAMCEHYGASLPVLVQSLRLLEDGGVLRLRRGRKGGIVASSDRSAHAIRLAHTHFVSNSVPVAECDNVVRIINVALIDHASRGTSSSTDGIENALAAMRCGRDATTIGMHWYGLQRALSDLAENPVLHLLARCLAAFIVRFRPARALLKDEQARVLLGESERIITNVKARINEGSASAHHRCQEALKSSW